MKVTETPEQTEVLAVDTVMVGTPTGATDIVTAFDVAVVPVEQATLEVITQVTTSLLLKVVDEYVEELAPTLVPFSFH